MARTSYSRNCRYCGRKINLRKMPHGQWVAFEGFATVHKCSQPAPWGVGPGAPYLKGFKGYVSPIPAEPASQTASQVPASTKPLFSPEAEWPLGMWIGVFLAVGWLAQTNEWLGRAGLVFIVAYKLYGGLRQVIPILQTDSSHLMPWSDRANELREDPVYQRERKLVVIVLLTIFCIIGFLARDNAFDWLGALVVIPAIWTMFEVWRLRNV